MEKLTIGFCAAIGGALERRVLVSLGLHDFDWLELAKNGCVFKNLLPRSYRS